MTAGIDIGEETGALDYLRAGSGEPWRWAEGGEVLAWNADGGTVVFREELLAILEGLAPGGLPPFPALALLLAACRGHTPHLDEVLGPAEAVGNPSDTETLVALRRDLRRRCDEILHCLRGLNGWPKGLLASARAKATLAEAVFERSGERRLSPARAHEIIAGWRQGLLTEAQLNHPTGRRVTYLHTLQALEGLRDVTPEALAMRLRTGLDAAVVPAPLPEEAFRPPAELARQLLDQLQRDPVHAGLARVARDLLAALSLPRRLPEPDDAVSGGVADVANRGSLDKLLLSELANDDLTLAVRVALNEALYLRHEPPAAAKAVSIALLLDAGVRMWGVPRLFAASAALALGAADARRPALAAWRAHGAGIEPVDLLSAEGFRQHLGALRTEAHPGAALPAFLTALAPPAGGHVAPPETEAVILTHHDALTDAGFRRALDGLRMPPGVQLLVAVVDRTGRFELWEYPSGGKRPICEATIRLDKIQRAEPESRPAPLLDGRSPEGLPVILSLPKFPFLLPVREEISAACVAPDGHTLAVTDGRALLSWQDTTYGATLLAAGLPAGRTLVLHPEADSGRIHILKAAWQKGYIPLSTYDANSGNVRTVPLVVRNPPAAARIENGVILLFYPTRADVFRLSDGEKLQSIAAPPRSHHVHGRYYRVGLEDKRHWYFAAWDGLAGGFNPVSGDVQTAVALFDREGQPGPWVLTAHGEVRHLESGRKIFSLGQTLTPGSQVRISRDGHHLRIVSMTQKSEQRVDLQKNHAYSSAFQAGKPANYPYEPIPATPQYPIMVHFSSVCVLPTGGLALRSGKDRLLEPVRRDSNTVALQSVKSDNSENRERPFVPLKLPNTSTYELQEARWPDGSRAFLDSRGLLHLKSSDRALPEISFVLANAPSALWTSDGRMAGAGFFLGPDRSRTELDELYSVLNRFCDRLR